MSDTVGIVVPAYEPDPERLVDYVEALGAEMDPARIRIELDCPETAVVDRLSETSASVGTWPVRRGKGAAITAGFEALDTAKLAFADADGSTPPASVADVVAALDGADLAVGSRRHPDAIVQSHQTFVRRSLGDAFAWTARRLLPVELYDYQCGAKALTQEAWGDLRQHLSEPGFAWDLELIGFADEHDLGLAEVPVTWRDAPGSTVDPLSTAVSLAGTLITIRTRLVRLDRRGVGRSGTLVTSTGTRTPHRSDTESLNR